MSVQNINSANSLNFGKKQKTKENPPTQQQQVKPKKGKALQKTLFALASLGIAAALIYKGKISDTQAQKAAPGAEEYIKKQSALGQQIDELTQQAMHIKDEVSKLADSESAAQKAAQQSSAAEEKVSSWLQRQLSGEISQNPQREPSKLLSDITFDKGIAHSQEGEKFSGTVADVLPGGDFIKLEYQDGLILNSERKNPQGETLFTKKYDRTTVIQKDSEVPKTFIETLYPSGQKRIFTDVQQPGIARAMSIGEVAQDGSKKEIKRIRVNQTTNQFKIVDNSKPGITTTKEGIVGDSASVKTQSVIYL